MKKKFQKVLCFLLVLTITLQLAGIPDAKAATAFSSSTITAYTISTGRVSTYKSVNGAYSGYISGSSDQCKILQIYDNGWCKVRYPVARGTKDAYTQTSNFLINTDFSTAVCSLGAKKTVYRRQNLSQKLGTVYSSDAVIVVGQSGGKTQIIYPLDSGGYKCGWVSGEYYSGENKKNIADGYYQIKTSLNTDYVLDVYGARTDNGVNLQLYTNKGETNQGFIIKKESDGYYSIAPIHAQHLRMDVEGGGTALETNVLLWQDNGGDNQRWEIIETSDGYYSFKSKCNGLYLDVRGGQAYDENNIWCYEGNGSKAQKFVLASVTVDGQSYSGGNSNTNTTNDVERRLNELINQYVGTTWNGYYYGSQCKGFANLIFNNLFGVYIGAYDESTKSYIPNPNGAVELGRLSGNRMTVENAKNLLLMGQPGDYIQVRRRGRSYGHTMILVGTSDSGIIVFDCNSDGRNGVKKYDISWQSFYNSNSAMSLYHATNYQ